MSNISTERIEFAHERRLLTFVRDANSVLFAVISESEFDDHCFVEFRNGTQIYRADNMSAAKEICRAHLQSVSEFANRKRARKDLLQPVKSA